MAGESQVCSSRINVDSLVHISHRYWHEVAGIGEYPRLQSALNKVVESQEEAETILNDARFSAKFSKDYRTREALTAQGATAIAATLKDTLQALSAHGMLVKHEMKQVPG